MYKVYMFLVVLLISSCRPTRLANNDCKLISDSLVVRGSFNEAPSIKRKGLIPKLAGDLIFGYYRGYKDFYLHHWHESRSVYPTDVLVDSFEISGCSDTIQAKNLILNELMRKYEFGIRDTVVRQCTIKVKFDTLHQISALPCKIASHEFIMDDMFYIDHDKKVLCNGIIYKCKELYIAGTGINRLFGEHNEYVQVDTPRSLYRLHWNRCPIQDTVAYLQELYEQYGVYHEVLDTNYIIKKILYDKSGGKYK